jgi:phage tail-like protein
MNMASLNYFSMEFIVMSEIVVSKDEMQEAYPLPVYRYICTIGGEEMFFSEVSGLDIKYDPITYKDGIKVQYMAGQEAEHDISLKKGILKSDSKFYDWISETSLNLVNKKDIMISLTKELGDVPLVSWKATKAFPISLIGPAFNASSNEVSIEQLDLKAQTVVITRP